MPAKEMQSSPEDMEPVRCTRPEPTAWNLKISSFNRNKINNLVSRKSRTGWWQDQNAKIQLPSITWRIIGIIDSSSKSEENRPESAWFCRATKLQKFWKTVVEHWLLVTNEWTKQEPDFNKITSGGIWIQQFRTSSRLVIGAKRTEQTFIQNQIFWHHCQSVLNLIREFMHICLELWSLLEETKNIFYAWLMPAQNMWNWLLCQTKKLTFGQSAVQPNFN